MQPEVCAEPASSPWEGEPGLGTAARAISGNHTMFRRHLTTCSTSREKNSGASMTEALKVGLLANASALPDGRATARAATLADSRATALAPHGSSPSVSEGSSVASAPSPAKRDRATGAQVATVYDYSTCPGERTTGGWAERSRSISWANASAIMRLPRGLRCT